MAVSTDALDSSTLDDKRASGARGSNMGDNSQVVNLNKGHEGQQRQQTEEEQQRLDWIDETDPRQQYWQHMQVPYSHRFHLSAARADLRTHSAATASSYAQLSDETLTFLYDTVLLQQFKANTTGRQIIVSEPQYDNSTLWRIHDVYHQCGAVSRSLDTLVDFVAGRHRTSIVLDTNDYFVDEEEEAATVEELRTNELYIRYARGISKLNKKLNMNEYEKMLLTNCLVYGKAALLIEYDKDPYEVAEAIPVAVKPLNSLRIGRVFYYADDWSLAGIEYLDFANVILEPYRLIYMTNKDFHISPRTLHHGVSIVESVLDIAETLVLNNQTNIKEINRRLWAALLIIKYAGKKQSDIDLFKRNYKVGSPIISNRDFDAQVVEVAHDLDKLLQQQEISDKTIARHMKVPVMFTGFDEQAGSAGAGSITQTFLSSTIEMYRTQLRNVLEPQWVNMLLKRLIILNDDVQTFLNLIPEDNLDLQQHDEIEEAYPDSAEYQRETVGYTSITEAPIPVQPSEFCLDRPEYDFSVDDFPFKLKINFAGFALDSILDKASAVIGLHKEGIIDTEVALQELDRKQYIGHMREVEEEQALIQQEQQQMQMEQQQQQMEMQQDQADQDRKTQVEIAKSRQAAGGLNGPNPSTSTTQKVTSRTARPNPQDKAARGSTNSQLSKRR